MDETPEEGPREVAAALNQLTTGMVRYLLSDRQGMSLTTAAALNRLEQEGPIRLTALAAAEGIAQPSMTVLVQRLEAQGLATRVGHSEDGRVRLVAITDAGRALMAERRSAQSARVADLLAALPEHDVRALGEAMRTALPIVQRMVQAAPQPGVPGGGSAP
ncbi:MarR family winged helix-turn-helix transcriptional regulator [Streptantibioticus ferralitis]|uniref:MarR family winged helix-turn-helix transcriptional regulator n=1 Tax=Streptantibioticus ferralitis TaxID=236510 RepID=A0ABT5ZC35_9ACTN|nr:MarR family winged helix-turn-helix transcriptional regulator [Streptantibioticus ferralitis]MDF2261404.1 MarR family winged helix-turn-helix transcriptional regulator [Streptantibioticus ferralitis]